MLGSPQRMINDVTSEGDSSVCQFAACVQVKCRCVWERFGTVAVSSPLRDPGRAFPIDLYLQHRSRKRLVNPFSLRPLICSYLLQHPKKSRGIFPSLLPIDSALRKSALLSKHYWSPCSPRQLLHQCIKGLDELKFHFRQLVPFIFCLFFRPRSKTQSVARRGSIAAWRLKVKVSRGELFYC